MYLDFDRYEHDQISDTDYFYFAIIEEETNETIHSFYLTGETDINMLLKKFESTAKILVGHYNYKTSDFFYSKAVNNIGDQILTTDETIKDEIKFLEEVASGYTTREKEECRNALINFIEERKNQGLSLFETEEQKQNFISHCLSQLEE